MNEKAVMKIEKRETAGSRTSRQLRRKGYLPGSVFGKGLKAFPVMLKEDDFKKTLSKFGRNYLYTLDLDGKETYTVMIKDIQRAPVRDDILNVAFHQVSLSEEMKVHLEMRITGREGPESNGLLVVRQLELIPVKGLPQHIPDNIEIDVSNLGSGDRITIADINFPEGITADIEQDQIVVLVNPSVIHVTDEVDEEKADEESQGVPGDDEETGSDTAGAAADV